MAAVVEQSPPPPHEPERVLGTVSAGCVVVGAIIGVGIFFTPSRVAALTHTAPLALLAWAIAGFIALCGALTFAALGRRYHASGAQYQILRDAYGPMPAFLFVFCNATAIQAGAIGIIAWICTQNLAAAAGVEQLRTAPALALSLLLIAGLAGANVVGVRWGAAVQNLTVAAKLLTLLAVTGLAVAAGQWPLSSGAPPEPEAPASEASIAVAGVMAALVPAFFSYGGWQHALWIAGEVRDPSRTLPRAIVGGVLLVVLVYLAANWGYMRLLGPEAVASSNALAADAVGVAMPSLGRRLIGAAVAVSAFGVLNAQLLSGPRLLFGMARDGRFFNAFGLLHRRFGTPWCAVLLLGALASLLLVAAGPDAIDRLLTAVVFIDGVFFALTGAAVFVLARRPGAAPIAAPGLGIVAALFVIGEIGIVIGAYLDPGTRSAAVIGGAWIVAAAVLYLARFRTR